MHRMVKVPKQKISCKPASSGATFFYPQLPKKCVKITAKNPRFKTVKRAIFGIFACRKNRQKKYGK